jgi:hypothetical protein
MPNPSRLGHLLRDSISYLCYCARTIHSGIAETLNAMPTRYTTDYSDPQGARFCSYVECGPMAWVVCIVDLRPTDPIIHQPIKVFGDFVEDPEAGKVMVEARLPWFLRSEHLPNQLLTWEE